MSVTSTPQATEAEKAVLSLILQDPHKFLPLARAGGICSEHFFHSANERTWQMFLKREEDGSSFDPTTITMELKDAGQLEMYGGQSAFSELHGFQPIRSEWSGHLATLRTALAMRKAQEGTAKASQAVADRADASTVAKILSETAEAVAAASEPTRAAIDAREAFAEFVATMEELIQSGGTPGISTGLPALDAATGGARKGSLWVVGGKTSDGKSVLCLQLAGSAIKEGKRVVVFTLELSAVEVFGRMVSQMGGIPYDQITNPATMTKGYLQRLKDTAEEIKNSQLYIVDDSNQTLDTITAKASVLSEQAGPLDMVVVDYLQLVEGATGSREARHEQVAAVSRGLKQLAKRLQCPVITASQLNDDGRLRESRAIGHDADVVLMIDAEAKGVWTEKNRNGIRNHLLPLKINGMFQRFEESGR